QFDAQGNLRDWWTPADAAEFEKRTACVADQYGQYTVVDDVKINSRLTLGEDVADLGGPLLALDAWRDAGPGRPRAARDGLGREPEPGAALRRRLRPVGLRGRASREQARQRRDQPPLASRVPRERGGGERAGLPGRLLVQGRPAHGQDAGHGLPRLVRPVRPPARAGRPSSRPPSAGRGCGTRAAGPPGRPPRPRECGARARTPTQARSRP